MSKLLADLSGGDRRSIGKSNLVVGMVLDVRMRCADVAEKISAVHPDWLSSHKKTLFGLAAKSAEKELRWHLAQMLPRLNLDRKERRKSVEIMQVYLSDQSSIVKTFAMQALADFAINDVTLRRKLLPQFEEFAQNGSPAMRARARKLIIWLNKS
jgi:hypothetical protein